MWKLYEIFKVLKIQKRIVSTETIRGNTVRKKIEEISREYTGSA
jgi:hypothetical protein